MKHTHTHTHTHTRTDTAPAAADGHSHVFLGTGHEQNERKTWAVIVLCTVMMVIEIAGGKMLRVEEIALGTISECIAHPREVFRPALIHSAFAVILAHNHPSGDPSPSAADVQMSRRMAEAAKILQIRLLDHVIIGAPAEGRLPFYSFKEAGVL